MRKTVLFILILSIGILGTGFQQEMDKSARKKLDKAVVSAFDTDVYDLLALTDASPLNGRFYMVSHQDSLLGYVYVGSSPGRYENFDLAVLYTPGWIIAGVEILVYRSSHGFEIMNRRWLAQFIGSDGCGLVYAKDIDAISGATISGNSLVNALSDICHRIKSNANFDPGNY